MIEAVKQSHPQYRHRRIQGMLQQKGIYLSASAIYGHLKELGQIEPYARRAAPWKTPHYEVWQRNVMWGSDWTKLSVGGVRWYLLTVIDFFSRLIVAFDVVPTVNAGNVKAIVEPPAEGIQHPLAGFVLAESGKEFLPDIGPPSRRVLCF